MNVLVDKQELKDSASLDRRDHHQPSERLIGRLISCTGSRGVISTSATNLSGTTADFWSIGRLISINIGETRIVGIVYEMNTSSDLWSDTVANIIYVKVELVGEISDTPTGPAFRRGITSYPHLGAIAHRIRASDLQAVYRVGHGVPVEIGKLSQDPSIPAAVNINDMLSRHFAVVGTTGVGKSSAVSILLRSAISVKPNLRVLILDPHNEYTSAFPDISVTIDASTLELPFWMFKLEEFVEVVFRGRKPSDGETDILRDMIALAKARYNSGGGVSSTLIKRPLAFDNGGMTADMPVPYRMSDLLKLIDDTLGKLDPGHDRTDLRMLKNRLDSLCHDPRFKFMFTKSTIEDNLDRVVSTIFRIPRTDRPITVFQLAGLPSEVVNSVASVLARMAFDLAMMSHGAYEILLLCEEAHRYVPQDPKLGFVPTRLAIARIAKEGRKYGAYLGMVTQRPGELDPTILSQCSTLFAMRLANEHDQEIIRSAIADSSASTISFLSSIGNREAIAFGEAIPTPMRMKFLFQNKENLPKTASGIAEVDRTSDASTVNLRALIARMRGADPEALA
ncbi:MAG: DUF87 domain-containing protein [Beijerinckiaceae bacterium]|nr:DUF87 domain-containing protein [Beijerinckiaceae bacterium]